MAAMLAALCLLGAGRAQAQFLDPATQQKVRAATFEVVMAKPADDPITYEKPLPLELLPYQFRNDKYFSIGTAFALGQHRYVTAAHVIGAGFASQWGTPALRDGAGRVYPIARIVKYSSAEDFAEFTLAEEPEAAPLQTGPRPALNEPVYAVGNALGEGVVIRDGLYTSDTPEERDGRWKWLRFSAAASPGNSGGPLLDKDGRVIGVVLRKSPNENLNYAVFIGQVLDARDDIATIDARETYQLDIFAHKQTEILKKEFELPKGYADFSKTFQSIWYAFDDQMMSDLLKAHADTLFPHGEGSAELLRTVQAGDVPGLIVQSEDGRWQVQRASQTGRAELGHNGFVTVGRLANFAALRLRRPDDAPAAAFYTDSRLYMDAVLKAMPLHRTVGAEAVKMVSLGKAQEETVYTDAYRRKWQLRTWVLPYQDLVVISMALPLPEGYAALLRVVHTAQVHDNINDFKSVADFFSISYSGTLEQWNDFRALPDLLPERLAGIELRADYGKSLRYESPRCAFSYGQEVQKINRNSQLVLDFSYFEDHGRPVWDVARVRVSESAASQSFVSIARSVEPAAAMADEYKGRWTRVARRLHPYDGVISKDGDLTVIHGVHEPARKAGEGEAAVLYTVLLQNDGVAAQDAMSTRLAQLMQALAVKDDLAPRAAAAAED